MFSHNKESSLVLSLTVKYLFHEQSRLKIPQLFKQPVIFKQPEIIVGMCNSLLLVNCFVLVQDEISQQPHDRQLA